MYFRSPVPLAQTTSLLVQGEVRDFVPTSDLRVLLVQE